MWESLCRFGVRTGQRFKLCRCLRDFVEAFRGHQGQRHRKSNSTAILGIYLDARDLVMQTQARVLDANDLCLD